MSIIRHNLNKRNIEKFINRANEETKPIISKIIKNTLYITINKFLKLFLRNLKVFLRNYKKKVLYIFIDKIQGYKQKSNYWLYEYIKEKLPTYVIHLISNFNYDLQNFDEDDYILFIDDCIYSGNQLGGQIANFIYYNESKMKINNYTNIFVLVPFIASTGMNYLNEIFKDNNEDNKFRLHYNKFIIKPINTDDLLTRKEIDIMNKYYPQKIYGLENSGSHYFESKSLIYFQHKIGDLQSTIPLFYNGLIPNDSNLEILMSITKDNYEEMIKKLEVITLISNCNDSIIITCPKPPYK